MTNDVENLILKNEKNIRDLNFSEKNAYLLYEIIWNFIIETRKYESLNTIITIKFHFSDRGILIGKVEDIEYKIKDSKLNSFTWFGYYDNSCQYKINCLINTIIDLDTLINLLNKDNFGISIGGQHGEFLLDIVISNRKINNIINNVLESNGKVKKLSKED